MRTSNALSLVAVAALFFRAEATSGQSFGSWDAEFIDLAVDFSMDSDDELVVSYSVAKKRVYESDLLAEDCETPINGINITMVPSRTPKPEDATRDLIGLAYSLDKSQITKSNIWNDALSKIEVCQIFSLVLPSPAGKPKMVITTDKRKLDIDFDLSTGFEVKDKPLELGLEMESTNVTSYIESFKCGGVQDFNANLDPLLPSTDLFVCIKSISTDVTVDFLKSMTLTQGSIALDLIQGNVTAFPSVTSREYVPIKNGVVVATRVPTSQFNFADGEYITITGEIDMKLAGSGRRLQSVSANNDESEIASLFQLEIALLRKIKTVLWLHRLYEDVLGA